MSIIACSLCSTEFEAKTNRARYCSQRCRDKGKPSASGLTCYVCDGPMVKGRTSRAQGEAAHNKCMPHGGSGLGHPKACRCDACRKYKAAVQREYLPAYNAAYKLEHGEHPNTAYRRRYRAKHGHNPANSGNWIDSQVRFELYERDGWKCLLCGDPIDRDAHWNDNLAPSLDHILPRSLGGSHDPKNLQTAHRACNSARGVKVDI